MTDVITFGPDRPPGRRPRWLVPLLIVAAAGMATGTVLARHGSRPGPVPAPTGSTRSPVYLLPTGPPCAPASPAPEAPGPAISGLVIADPLPGGTLERCDRTADTGPWTVVVRQPDGSLGRRGAVVTYPVAAPTAGRSLAVGAATGRLAGNTISWPVAGGYARVRGDLSAAQLVAVAAGTSIRDGHPAVDAPAGLQVVSSGPYRPLVIAETRYAADALGEQATLQGLVFAGLTTGGGFEDQLFAQSTQDSDPVDGHPALIATAFGGNAALAWEPAPGTIAYVGYSGAMSDAATTAALHRLAARAHLLSPGQWQRTSPAILDQANDPA